MSSGCRWLRRRISGKTGGEGGGGADGGCGGGDDDCAANGAADCNLDQCCFVKEGEEEEKRNWARYSRLMARLIQVHA